MPRDAVRTVQQYGDALRDYVREHVRPMAADGRPWTVTVRDVTPVVEQEPDVRVALVDDSAARRARGPDDPPLRRDHRTI